MGDRVRKLYDWLNVLREVGWLVGVVSVALAGLWLFAWQALVMPLLSKRTVYARDFVVEDATGTRRVALGMQGTDGVALQLFDAHGRQRAKLGLAADGGTALQLADEHGPRLSLDVEDYAVALQMFNKGSKRRAVKLAVGKDGSVALGLGEAAPDQFQVTIAQGPDKSGLIVSDGVGKLLIGVELVRHGGGVGHPEYVPILEVWDASRRQVVWRALNSSPPAK